MVKDNNIEIQNLSLIKNKKKILSDINLNIPSNKVVCLVGPSGCGKTSLLRVIAGLDNLNLGKIFFKNKIFSKPNYSVPTEKRNIGLVFQESNLFPHLNIFNNVSFGSKKKEYKDIQRETFEILRKIGLPHYSNTFPHQLSAGQKQLVSIARSLVTKPELLMMDEPFANLDQRLKNKIRDVTLHLLQKTATTALIITHDPDDAMFIGDYIAVMNEGKILQFDRPSKIYNNPKSSFVARFFGETLTLRCKIYKNKANTIFGPIKVKLNDISKAKEVEIVFRPEAFKISKNSSKKDLYKIKSKIIAIKYIGKNSYLHLDILNKLVKKHIHIKVSGKFIPPKNKICYISIGKRDFFIFKYK